MSYPCSDCGGRSAHGPEDCICEEEEGTADGGLSPEYLAKYPFANRPRIGSVIETTLFEVSPDALELIDHEMQRQVDKFGYQNHEPKDWYLILGEEFGEVGKAILEKQWSYPNAKDNYEEELIQVAAVAVSALQCLWRSKEYQAKLAAEDRVA